MKKFNLGMNATKNTDYIEKFLKQKLRRIKFPEKCHGAHISTSAKSGVGVPKIWHFWNNTLEWESRFTLGLNTVKNTDYIKNCLKQKLCRIKFPKKIS